MRFPVFAFALAVGLALAGASGPAAAQSASTYVPAPGEEVVVYIHRFKAENFAEGLKLVKEGFTAAQAAAGQTRMNQILVNPSQYEVVLVSFFGPGSSVDEWHKFMGRLDVLKTLEPMRREPLILQRYTLDSTTTAP